MTPGSRKRDEKNLMKAIQHVAGNLPELTAPENHKVLIGCHGLRWNWSSKSEIETIGLFSESDQISWH